MNMKYFNIAREVSRLSDFKRIHIGCVIVYKHNIIATGYNSTKSHPMQKEYNKYRFKEDCIGNGKIHAEMKAMLSIPKGLDMRKVIVYTYREGVNGELRNSRPCAACLAKIMELGIRYICYTTNEGFAEEELV